MRNGRATPSRQITFVTASYPRFAGGGSRVVYEHANRLAESGHRVRIVHSLALRRGAAGLPDRARDAARTLRSGQLRRRIDWIERHPRVEVVTLPRLDALADVGTTDLFVPTFWSTNAAIDAIDNDTPRLQLMQAFESWAAPPEVIRAVWRTAHHKAVVSRQLERVGLDLGVPPHLLHLVPNGIDPEVFHLRNDPMERPPSLAFLAHEDPVKGLDVAVQVAERVRARHPDIPVLAFGAMPRPASLPSWIGYLRGATGERLATEIYGRAAVFVCPSRSEGWGFPALEAMACGAALVSTRNGGVQEFAVEDETALFTDVDDVTGLAQACLRLLEDDDLRRRLTAAGASTAGNYSWAESAKAMARAVDAALEGADG